MLYVYNVVIERDLPHVFITSIDVTMKEITTLLRAQHCAETDQIKLESQAVPQSAQDSPALLSSILDRYCAPQIKQKRCCLAIRVRVSDPLVGQELTTTGFLP
jgi:hypothetical protein